MAYNLLTLKNLKKSRYNIQLGILILCLSSSLHLKGNTNLNEEDLMIRQFSIEEGLKQSMVKQILIDSQGFFWLATGEGLHLFDGIKFRHFRFNYSDGISNEDKLMRTILEIKPHEFLISTNSGILLFSSKDARFANIKKASNSYPCLFPQTIGECAFFWFYTDGYYAYFQHDIIPLRLVFPEKDCPPTAFMPVTSVLTSDKHYLIFGKEGYIDIILDYRNPSRILTAKWNQALEPFKGVIKSPDDHIYAMFGPHLYIYSKEGHFKSTFSLITSGYKLLLCEQNEKFWFFNPDTKDLIKKDSESSTHIKLYSRQGKFAQTVEPYIITSTIDKQGNIWFGTDGDGLLQFAPSSIQFKSSTIGFTKYITGDSKGNIWVGTFKNGLWKLSPDLSVAKQVPDNTTPINSNINGLFFDSHNRLWLLTDKYLKVTDPANRTLLTFSFQSVSTRIIEINDTSIFISTDNYVYCFSHHDYPRFLNKEPNAFITSALKNNELLWVGTHQGLYAFPEKKRYHIDMLTRKSQVSPLAIKTIAIVDSLIWASTTNGLVFFDYNKSKTSFSFIPESLKHEIVYSIMTDKQNRVWVSLNKGIACISASRDKIYFFGSYNNLQSLEFNSNAFYKSDEGLLYWGGINGVNALDPELFNPKNQTASPRLLSLFISDSLAFKGIPAISKEVFISWKAPVFSGEVISSDYTNSKHYSFSFYLEGFDKTWSAPSSQGNFQFRNLTSGNFKFYARCFDEYGNPGPAMLIASFKVSTPFWKTIWFYLSAFTVVIALTAFIVKKVQSNRYQQTIKELEQQNAIEKERLRISRDLHDDLGAGLSLILLNTSLAQQKADDKKYVESYLFKISKNTKDLFDNLNNLIWLLKQENQSLDNLFSKIREVISDAFSEAFDNYAIQLPENCKDITICREACRNIFLIIKEASNNAIKHSHASFIQLKAEIDSEQIVFQIIDNGKGFDIQSIRHGSNGLNNMKSRTEALNGNFSIETHESQGTTLVIKIPLKSLMP